MILFLLVIQMINAKFDLNIFHFRAFLINQLKNSQFFTFKN